MNRWKRIKTAKKTRHPRIFLGLLEIAGYYSNLESGFRQLDIYARHIDAYGHSFHYKSHEINRYLKAVKFIGMRLLSTSDSRPIRKKVLIVIHKIILAPVFLWALLKFDVFIFGFGTSFFYFMDLPILKLFGKKVLYIFHGSDSRAPYIDGFVESIPNTAFLHRLCSTKKKAITKIEKHTDAILSYPLYAHLNSKKIVNNLFIGLPVAVESATFFTHANSKSQESVRILHCPSNTAGKGTDIIRTSVDRLKKRGFNINYVEITNKPHSAVLSELVKCDFVIDQLYSDAPMAGFATEAAFFEKPAIVGGYGWEWVEEIYPPEILPPTSRCLPSQIEQAIERMIIDRDYRLRLGKKAYEFVSRMWRPSEVARKILCVAKGQTPEGWYYDPMQIRYIYGAGISKRNLQKRINELIISEGLSALCIEDKPDLKAQFKKFASSINAAQDQD